MKNSVTFILLCMSTLVLSSCGPQMTPEQKAALMAAANRPVTCKVGTDCEQKWSKATQWVKQNCAYKFQTVSDNVIQTMGPLSDDPRPAYTITKVSASKKIYTIELDGGCDNMFGCIPSMLESKAGFAGYVMGSGN